MTTEDEATGFVSGLEIARQRGLMDPTVQAPPGAYLMEIVAPSDRLWKAWRDFHDLKSALLNDPNCYDTIEGQREMNRTGATRLATAFGLSIETVHIAEVGLDSDDRRFQVRVRVSKGPRFADGVGSARMSEIPAVIPARGKPGDPNYRPERNVPIGQREHFALTRAATRATKRAIADIVGGTEAE